MVLWADSVEVNVSENFLGPDWTGTAEWAQTEEWGSD